MPSRNEADTGFDVTRHESEPTSDGCFVARQHEELPAGGNANGDNGSTVDRCALHPTREGSFTWVSRRGLDHYNLITGPAEELAFEGLEPYEGKLSRTVLRGAWVGNNPGLPGGRQEKLCELETWKSLSRSQGSCSAPCR